MKLHDLQVGDRFTFTDKHRGKVFEVTGTTSTIEKVKLIIFQDVATGEVRNAFSNRKTFRMEVRLETENRVVELTEREQELLRCLLYKHYTYMCEMDYTESEKGEVDNLFCKLTGSAGRRVVRPEGE